MELKFEKDYRNQKYLDIKVSELDPLGADNLFVELPNINKFKDSSLLFSRTSYFAEKVLLIDDLSQEIALAILRDLGMLGSALTKQEIIVASVPFLEEALTYVGKYAGEVPRDTFFSYTSRNPQKDGRLRKYTALSEEILFIDSLKKTNYLLYDCIYALQLASQLSIFDPNFGYFVNQATKNLQTMVETMIVVKKNIAPEVFTLQIRPFFEPYKVYDVEYHAPGASSMPVNLIDKLLWSDKNDDSAYQEYYQNSVSYMPFSYRYLANQLKKQSSLLTKIFQELDKKALDEISYHSIQAVLDCVNTILKFRGPHKKVVDDNFKLRNANARGSGGLQKGFLDYLIQETFHAVKRLKLVLSQNTNDFR